MNTPISHRTVGLVSLALLVIVLLGNSAQAQPTSQQTASENYRVALPLVIGGSGGGASPPANPVAVHFIHDASRSVHAAIGPEGGTLNAIAADGTRFELFVPPGSLDFIETITLTPVLRAEGLPFSNGPIGAVNLEPAGLSFYEPALLRVIPPALGAGPLTIGFTYDGAGEQFHLRPLFPGSGQQLQPNAFLTDAPVIGMQISSIRPVGVGSGNQADLTKQQTQPAPSDPMDATEQQLVLEPDMFVEALASVFDTVVRPNLQQAETNDQLTDLAITKFDQWLHWVDTTDSRTHFISQFSEGRDRIRRILLRSSANAAERCFSQKRPEEGFRLLRWMRYAKTYLGSSEVAAIEAKLRGCLTFELTFHSHLTEQAPGFGYVYTLEANKIVLQASTAGMRAVGSGPLNWLEFSWTAGGPCLFNTAATPSSFDVQTLPGLTITPVSRTSPAVNITLHYDPGIPGERTTITCPGAQPVVANTNGWRSYFEKMHADERVGNGYRVTSRVVGAGKFPGWVYHLTTTGPSGQEVIEDTQISIEHKPQQ